MVDFTRDEFINRGQRLISLTTSPGWHDLQQIVEDLCFQTAQTLIKFEGFEPLAIQALQSRAKVAYELRDAIYLQIQQQISMGQNQESILRTEQHIAEPESQKTDDADTLRERALRLFDQLHPAKEAAPGQITFS